MIGKVLMGGMALYGNYATYKYDKEQGKSVAYTGVKLAAEAALFSVAPVVGAAYMGGMMAGGAVSAGMAFAQNGGKQSAQQVNNVYRNTIGGNFNDTENGSTMRQRGLSAIQHSGNNLNQVFGNEARTFYRGMR